MQEGVRVYFDTMLYLNKFHDLMTVKPETNNMFNKVKSGEFRLVVSQLTFVEIYHVLCLPLEKIPKFEDASELHAEINSAYHEMKTKILHFPNTEIVENEFDGVDTKKLTTFVEHVPGSGLISFHGMRKYPGSMDFIHIMTATNLRCTKFITADEGVILLDSYNFKDPMKIIRPYRA